MGLKKERLLTTVARRPGRAGLAAAAARHDGDRVHRGRALRAHPQRKGIRTW